MHGTDLLDVQESCCSLCALGGLENGCITAQPLFLQNIFPSVTKSVPLLPRYSYFRFRIEQILFWLDFITIAVVGSQVLVDVRNKGRVQKFWQDYLVFNTFLSSGFLPLPSLISTLIRNAVIVARKCWISRQVNCNPLSEKIYKGNLWDMIVHLDSKYIS